PGVVTLRQQSETQSKPSYFRGHCWAVTGLVIGSMAAPYCLPLDAPLKDDSDTERIDFLTTSAESAEDKVAKKEMDVLLHNKIAEFRKKLTDRELEIFDQRIFSDTPVTLQEIGDSYGISRERVRQVEKSVVKKMRDFFKREIIDFDSYTDGNDSQ
ncbi:sigma factor-like helix-turn-helix DNA-binding protein, partial [Desulfobacterales bacterium HSG17]|nr:sigma factor-like helix-turn-helix DNA-binding protein [Desulfobacterales bacterium HSG17]